MTGGLRAVNAPGPFLLQKRSEPFVPAPLGALLLEATGLVDLKHGPAEGLLDHYDAIQVPALAAREQAEVLADLQKKGLFIVINSPGRFLKGKMNMDECYTSL